MPKTRMNVRKDGIFMPKNRNILILYAMALLQGMVFYGPIATLYRQNAGISLFEVTLIESVCLAVMVLLELPWGILADRIGYKKTILICSGLYLISKVVFWQAESFGAFLLERILLGVVCAGLSGVDTSMLYLSCPDDESAQRVFGIYQTMGTAGLLFAALFYGAFVGEDYRLAAGLTVVSYGLALVLSLFLQEVPRQPEARPHSLKDSLALLKALLKNRRFLLLIAAGSLMCETNQVVSVYLIQPRYSALGLSSGAISLLYGLMTLLGLLGGFSARLTTLLGQRRTGVLLLGSCALACLTLALTGSVFLTAAAVLLMRLSNSLFYPLFQRLQNACISTHDRATALSMGSLIMDLGAIPINLVFGRAADHSLSLSFGLGALLCGGSLALYLCCHRQKGCLSVKNML